MLTLFKIENKKIFGTNNPNLETENIYIIIDKSKKRAKMWIWAGAKANKLDKYHAGVLSTKLKSSLKLYGASVEVVEEGNEPKSLPTLTKQHIIEQPEGEIDLNTISDSFPSEKPKKVIKRRVESAVEEEPEIVEIASEREVEKIKPTDEAEIKPKAVFVEKKTSKALTSSKNIKTLLEDISSTLGELQNKIKNYLDDL